MKTWFQIWNWISKFSDAHILKLAKDFKSSRSFADKTGEYFIVSVAIVFRFMFHNFCQSFVNVGSHGLHNQGGGFRTFLDLDFNFNVSLLTSFLLSW